MADIPFIAVGNNEPIPDNLPEELKSHLRRGRTVAGFDDNGHRIQSGPLTEEEDCAFTLDPPVHETPKNPEEFVRAFQGAVLNQGNYPAYHAEQMAKLKQAWPTLYRLLVEVSEYPES